MPASPKKSTSVTPMVVKVASWSACPTPNVQFGVISHSPWAWRRRTVNRSCGRVSASGGFWQLALHAGRVRQLTWSHNRNASIGSVGIVPLTARMTSGSATRSLLRVRDRCLGRHVTGLLGAGAVGLNGRGLILRSVGYLLIFDDTGRGRGGRRQGSRRDRSGGRTPSSGGARR